MSRLNQMKWVEGYYLKLRNKGMIKSQSQFGFTLLEILVAVVILAIISALTAANISHSVKFKNKIEQDLDDYSAVRDTLVIMTKDINSAFHWIDIDAEMLKNMATPGASPTPTPINAANAIPYEKLTAFLGEMDSIYLTTLSHVRTTQNSQESDQAKVGYYLKEVKSLANGESTKALVRSESAILDGEPKKGGKETVLLEHIKAFKLRYMGNDDKDWQESWKSDETQDEATKNKFPDAVEITITTSHSGREITMSTMAAVHTTNNDLLTNLVPTAATPTPGAPATVPGAQQPGAVPGQPAAPGAIPPGGGGIANPGGGGAGGAGGGSGGTGGTGGGPPLGPGH